jgi:hypothetical protein
MTDYYEEDDVHSLDVAMLSKKLEARSKVW